MGNSKSKDEFSKVLEVSADHEDSINCFSMTEDMSLLVTGSEDKTLRVWSTKTPEIECIGVLRGHEGYITTVTVFDMFVISGSSDNTIRKWDMSTCECLEVYRGHTSRIAKVICNGEFIFSTSHDMTCKCWAFDPSQLPKGESACLHTFEGHVKSVVPVLFIADETTPEIPDKPLLTYEKDYLVTGSYDKSVRIWSLDTKECLHICNGHKGPITCLTVDEDGKMFYSGSEDKTVRSWNVETGACMRVFEGHRSAVICMQLVDEILYTGGCDGDARSWLTEHGDCTGVFSGHKHTVNGLKLDNGTLYTGSGDTSIRAYDIKSGKLRREYSGHESGVTGISIVDGFLFSVSQDGTLRKWVAGKFTDMTAMEEEQDDDDDEDDNDKVQQMKAP